MNARRVDYFLHGDPEYELHYIGFAVRPARARVSDIIKISLQKNRREHQYLSILNEAYHIRDFARNTSSFPPEGYFDGDPLAHSSYPHD